MPHVLMPFLGTTLVALIMLKSFFTKSVFESISTQNHSNVGFEKTYGDRKFHQICIILYSMQKSFIVHRKSVLKFLVTHIFSVSSFKKRIL